MRSSSSSVLLLPSQMTTAKKKKALPPWLIRATTRLDFLLVAAILTFSPGALAALRGRPDRKPAVIPPLPQQRSCLPPPQTSGAQGGAP